MALIENPDKKIKINSSMIEDFTSPVIDNPNTYTRVNSDGKIEFKTPGETAVELGGTFGSTITDWTPGTEYALGQLCTYQDCIFKCVVDNYISSDTFDKNCFDVIAGYSKNSEFFSDEENPITTVTLANPVANKEFIQVNVDNAILQTDQYELADDGVTVTFREPIPSGSQINILTYGNFSLINASKMMVKEFIAYEGQTVLDIGEQIIDKNLATINIENTEILHSEWKLDENRHIVTFLSPLHEGDRVQIIAWENIEVKVGATFIPHLDREENITTLSFSNDGGFANPDPVDIYDGATFIPHISKENYTTTLSWTNDAELENPYDVQIYDGIMYVPAQTKDGLYATISWSNNQGAENPEDVIIADGATFTPHLEVKPNESIITFTNDKNLENPAPLAVYTNYAQRIVDSFVATAEQQVFVASHEIPDKSVLSVNVMNSELTHLAFELGEDKKTVTLVNGVSEGSLVDLKYFYNLNFGVQGVTFKPQTEEVENGVLLTWENEQGYENPEPIIIPSGAQGIQGIPGEQGPKGEQGEQGPKGEQGSSIRPRGVWSETEGYLAGDYVSYEDDTAYYTYTALQIVDAGTPLTDARYWMKNFEITKYVTATMRDWGE